METGIEISDLTRITARDEIDGFRVKNKTELKDRYITADNVFFGMLFPDASDNLNLDGVALLNVRELTVVGLVDLLPYIQGSIDRTQESLVTPATPQTFFNDNVFETAYEDFSKKGITIVKATGQADENMLSFQRAGYYKIICNVERTIRTNKTETEFNLSGAEDWFNIGKYAYDSSTNTATINDRFSIREREEFGPPWAVVSTTHIRKKESEEMSTGVNESTRNFQFEFDVFISDPVTDRVKLEFISLNEDNPQLSVSDAILYIDYNYAISVNAWR